MEKGVKKILVTMKLHCIRSGRNKERQTPSNIVSTIQNLAPFSYA